ncbi:hypothetical protein Goshw_002814 [Gossypium schwendimanii]|uniref:Longin domain-containing protein n=1 Tax=Gossypium schwendimanii TaxID=34291 RepID=A0A7J9L0I8_GOSSC|nr:hypothetical protein [Gossypium schwendimanii]
MAILYAVVARGTVVLAEFSAVTGNTGAVARRILEKLPQEADSRLCLSQDRYIFHILRSDGLTFLCMANDTFGRRIPFSYLEDIHMRFMKNYGRVARYAPAYAMNDEFSRVLHQQMEFFSSSPSADTLNRVRGEVGEASILHWLEFHFLPDRTLKQWRYCARDFYARFLPQGFSPNFKKNSTGSWYSGATTEHRRFGHNTSTVGIRSIMVENIEKILERGDRIELLVDKTATMQDGAFHFKKQSKRLRQALWMKNAKLL